MINILITGDVYMGASEVEQLAENNNVESLFGEFAALIEEVDFAIANLESPITNDGIPLKKTGPYLKASTKSLGVLKKAGFDLLTLANNHIMDYSLEGLKSTITECKKLNLNHVGAGETTFQARQPFVLNLGGKTLSVINIAENEFSTIGVNDYGANAMDPINNSYDIKKAKEISDFVLVIVHGGREHYPLPSPNFKKTLRFFADCGADAVIAHHSHCVSGYEVYKKVPIFYGLGNFLFYKPKNPRKPLWNKGLAVKLILNDDNKLDFELFPYFQCRNNSVSIDLMAGKDKKEFLGYLKKINNIIGNEELLNDQWYKYVKNEKQGYESLFFVKNKWLRKLVNRKIIPISFFRNEKHETFLINLIRCETHKEILMDVLQGREQQN